MSRKNCPKTFPPQLQVLPLPPEEELELDFNICCCIEEIEATLSKNPTEKQKKLGEISLKILKNPGESFIKKKQVMRQWCGDYKKKFEGEKKNLIASLNDYKVSFKPSEASKRSLFLKKHSLNSRGDGDSTAVNGAISKKQNSEFSESNLFRFDFEDQ